MTPESKGAQPVTVEEMVDVLEYNAQCVAEIVSTPSRVTEVLCAAAVYVRAHAQCEQEIAAANESEEAAIVDALSRMKARAEAAEAEVRRLRKALEQYTSDKDWRLMFQMGETPSQQRWVWMRKDIGPWQLAADALAAKESEGR